MTDLEKKIAAQLAEWEPTEIKIDRDGWSVDFLAYGRIAHWAKLTPKTKDVKKNSVRLYDSYS